jgi:hypothetical protein
MSEVPKVETPELDRRSEIIRSGRAAAVQEFYDWLMADRQLCEWVDEEEQYLPVRLGSGEQVLADFFGIDLNKIETEQRALLDAIRSAS